MGIERDDLVEVSSVFCDVLSCRSCRPSVVGLFILVRCGIL